MDAPRFLTGYPRETRIVTVLLAAVLYLVLFPFFPVATGAGPGIIVLLPLLAAGGALGALAGTAVGMASHPANVIYGVLIGYNDWAFFLLPGNLVLWCGAIAIGAAVGYGSDLATRLRKSHRDLKSAMARIRRLEGLLPVCAHCKAIRDEEGKWVSMDAYLSKRTDVQLSHSVCPVCFERNYPEVYERPGEKAEATGAASPTRPPWRGPAS